jgi:hypothetical protein
LITTYCLNAWSFIPVWEVQVSSLKTLDQIQWLKIHRLNVFKGKIKICDTVAVTGEECPQFIPGLVVSGLCEVEVSLTFYQFIIRHRHRQTTVFLEQASPVKNNGECSLQRAKQWFIRARTINQFVTPSCLNL